jgi:hypothetical protein
MMPGGLEPAPTKPTKPISVSFVSSISAGRANIDVRAPSPAAFEKHSVFPHCPRCASYALYRQNNIGAYDCETCGLQGIEECTARRLQ